MKLGVTREQFESQIRKALYEAGTNRNTQGNVTSELMKKGYNAADITDIFEDNIKLNTLSLIDLGVIASILSREDGLNYVSPSLYLTDIELEAVKKHRFEEDNTKLEFPLIFNNCLQKASDSWITILHVEDIANLYRSNIVRYNFETQREARQVQTKDSVILAPDINWNAIDEISKELMQGTFISNVLTFNLRHTNFRYDVRHKKLIILDGKIDIIDGFHRSLAIIDALRKKDINFNFEIRFTNFDTDKAKRFVIQEDKRTPISKEYLRKIDTTDLISNIVNNLNEDGDSELRGLITTDIATIASGYSLVSFEMLYGVINELWEPITKREAEEVANHLKEFFNELVFIYPDEFKLHIKESRKFNQLNDEKMFLLYVILAKKLPKEKWGNNLKGVIDTIMNNKEYKEYMSMPPSVVKSRIKSRTDHVAKIVEGVI